MNLPTAFAKSQAAAYGGLPTAGTVFVSVADRHKRSIVFPVERLAEMGFRVVATTGTADVLRRYGIAVEVMTRLSERSEGDDSPSIVDLIEAGEIDMVVNTPQGQEDARSAGYAIRTAATGSDKAMVTTIQQFGLAVMAIESLRRGPFSVRSLQEYNREREEWMAELEAQESPSLS